MRSVWPSGADLATKSAPIWPLAPGRFSTTMACAQIPASLGSMMRASVSAPPPGGKGTTMRTGFEGKRSEEHTSELQSQFHLVCRLLLEKKKKKKNKSKLYKQIQ